MAMDFSSLPARLTNISSSKVESLLSPGDSNKSLSRSPRNSMVDYDFVQEPPPDFFCPVTLELLVDPQQTACCGNHISSEAATKLQREEKACPVCNKPNFESVADKHYRRRVLELRVKCPHLGCNWIGEVREYDAHVGICPKRTWNCEHCGLKCAFDEGEEVHWSECKLFPEPCPNNCEVRNVARMNVEQHRTVCSLEPITCEMSMYGCQAVVPRKDVPKHMKEHEGRHLISLAILNYKQLHLKNEIITELQQDVQHLQQHVHSMKLELAVLKKKSAHIENHVAGGEFQSCTIHTFADYSRLILSERDHESQPFFVNDLKFNFRIRCYKPPYDMIVIFLGLLPSDGDDELNWPVKVDCQVEQLNQIGERGHRKCKSSFSWTKAEYGVWKSIDSYEMKYSDLEKRTQNVQYLVKDTLVYRIHLSISS